MQHQRFFSLSSKFTTSLEFKIDIKANQQFVIFSLYGQVDEVKARMRVIVTDVLPDFTRYKKEAHFEYLSNGRGQHYDLYIAHQDKAKLVRILWYLGKIRGQFYPPNVLEKAFIDYPAYIDNEEKITVAKNLAEAAQEALRYQKQPLARTYIQPEDPALWTEAELRAHAQEENQRCCLI